MRIPLRNKDLFKHGVSLSRQSVLSKLWIGIRQSNQTLDQYTRQ